MSSLKRRLTTRYDENGQHDTGSAGEADPYKGGIDKELIGPEYYSVKEADRAVIERKSAADASDADI